MLYFLIKIGVYRFYWTFRSIKSNNWTTFKEAWAVGSISSAMCRIINKCLKCIRKDDNLGEYFIEIIDGNGERFCRERCIISVFIPKYLSKDINNPWINCLNCQNLVQKKLMIIKNLSKNQNFQFFTFSKNIQVSDGKILLDIYF